jgi:WS/DGAT/MGAT family acyltransferase
MHFVPRYLRGSALVCRVHHCLGDGISLMHVLLSLTDGGTPPPGEPDEGEQAGQSEQPLDRLDALFAALTEAGADLPGRLVAEAGALASDPARAMTMAASVAAGLGTLGKLALMEPDSPTVLKGPLGVEKRVAWSRRIPLGDLTRVARATGATVNDVLVSAVAGALRRYLLSAGASVARDLSVRAVVPVNLRPSADARRLGNEFGLVFLSLPIGTEEPLDRLFAARSGMDAIKRSPEARLTFQALRALGLAPQVVFDEVVAVFERKASCVVTNVSGPRQPVSCAGAPIRDIMFWVPRAGRLALGLSVLSYAGSVRLGVASDAQVVPEPRGITDAFVEELRGLRGWFGARRRRDSRGGRARREANERGLC